MDKKLTAATTQDAVYEFRVLATSPCVPALPVPDMTPVPSGGHYIKLMVRYLGSV